MALRVPVHRSPLRVALYALLALVLLDALLLLPGGRAPAAAPRAGGRRLRVGLVFDVGGRGDRSFNDSAYAGLMRASRELGVDAEYIEPAGGEDRESALRMFAARGFDLVVGVGFIFSSDLMGVAREYPHVRFAGIDFAPPQDGRIPPNLVGLKFREEEGAFLVGAMAALVSRTGRIGFVGGMDVPLIHKFEAGYRAGAISARPGCEVSVAYAGVTPDAFKDPARGKELALAQIGRGADVVFHASGSTGLGVFEAARQSHVMAIGVDADQYDDAPGTVVSSMIKRVDVVLVDVVRALQQGRFRGGIQTFGIAEDGVDWVHAGPHAARIPPAVVARVQRLRERIVRGAIHVPHDRDELERFRPEPSP